METWKDIKDFEGLYEVSNLGRIKSLANKKSPKITIYKHRTSKYYKSKIKEKIMKQGLVSRGYFSILLIKNKNGTRAYVHRLVAQTFIPNVENKKTVNHKDGNPKNNQVSNLEWATQRKYKSFLECFKKI